MLKIYFLYKTTNLVDGRVFFGVYASGDLFFGTEFAEDKYCGQNQELLRDVKRLGRQCFAVEAIHAFPLADDAYQALERYRPMATYKHGSLGVPLSQSTRDKMSEGQKGEKNGMWGKTPTADHKAAIAAHRRTTRWITDGVSSRQVPKGSLTPDGWRDGRPSSLADKVRKTQQEKALKNQ